MPARLGASGLSNIQLTGGDDGVHFTAVSFTAEATLTVTAGRDSEPGPARLHVTISSNPP